MGLSDKKWYVYRKDSNGDWTKQYYQSFNNAYFNDNSVLQLTNKCILEVLTDNKVVWSIRSMFNNLDFIKAPCTGKLTNDGSLILTDSNNFKYYWTSSG